MRALLFKVSKITLIPYSVNEHYQIGNCCGATQRKVSNGSKQEDYQSC